MRLGPVFFALGFTSGLMIAAFVLVNKLDDFKASAVQNGVAYYKVVDTQGHVEFKWITQ